MYLFRKNVITDIIESADDWLIFGTVQFGRVTSTNYAIDIFYKLIQEKSLFLEYSIKMPIIVFWILCVFTNIKCIIWS